MILVSFIIPTLNAGKVLKPCLRSIRQQSIKNVEIIIADGGSTDNTLKIAKNYKAKIVTNKLKTSESGKAIGLKFATGKFTALIDSDNILPTKNWLSIMLLPFKSNSKLIGSEPYKFTYRRYAGFIERYSALLGANDPYAWFIGVYDRYSYLTNKWTDLKIDQIDKDKYIEITLKPKKILPTIGANGTIFRSDFLRKNLKGDYLFDIDLISQVLNQQKTILKFAKVKTGIIHTYCESSIKKFIRKQNRRLGDYFFYKNLRKYNWQDGINNEPLLDLFRLVKNNFAFATYSLMLIPSIVDAFKGYFKKPDLAWFFHPLACLLSFFIFTRQSLLFLLKINKPINRQQWTQ